VFQRFAARTRRPAKSLAQLLGRSVLLTTFVRQLASLWPQS